MSAMAEKLIETIQQLTEVEREHIVTSVLKSTQTKIDMSYSRSYVVSEPAILSGEPIIRGTRTPIRAIVELWQMGVPPEEIPEHLPHISLARVFDALSYYIDHQADITRYIEMNRIPEHLIDPAVQNEKEIV